MGTVVDLIDEMLTKKASEAKPRTYLGTSTLGEVCDRKLWYSYKSPEPILDPRINRIFRLGHLIEKEVTDLITESGLVTYLADENGNQFGFTDGIIGGHCDGVIIVNELAHLLEIKSAKNSRFNTIKKEGIRIAEPIYYTQVAVYAEKLELKYIKFIVYNKDTSELYEEDLHEDPIEAHASINRGKDIGNRESEPERKYDHKSNFNCKLCSHRAKCWSDAD
jgi:hypothetical protein